MHDYAPKLVYFIVFIKNCFSILHPVTFTFKFNNLAAIKYSIVQFLIDIDVGTLQLFCVFPNWYYLWTL